MIEFLELILAAPRGRDGGKFQWLIPVVFAVVYFLSAIAKKKEKRDQDKKLDKEFDRTKKKPKTDFRFKAIDESGRPKPTRYKPLEDLTPTPRSVKPRQVTISRPGAAIQAPVPQRKVAHTAQRPIAQPQPRKMPKPDRHRPKAQEPARLHMKVPEVPQVAAKEKKTVQTAQSQLGLVESLADSNSLRRAIIYSEILGKPRSLRAF